VWLGPDDYLVRDARSLFEWMWNRRQIPVAGPHRICTRIAKVERFEAWLDDAYPGQLVEVWIGFEAGEEARAARDPNNGGTAARRPVSRARRGAVRANRFPLIEWRLCRCRCEALVLERGLPVPRKSACVFCPNGTRGDWQTFASELPHQFDAVTEMEKRKPPTRRGVKLSIMGFRTIRDPVTGRVLRHNAPSLSEFISGPSAPRPNPCLLCGATARATKATGCSALQSASP